MAAVFTGKDVKHLGPVPCGASLPGLRVPHHHLLAQDRVYFVGHPVAVVVATDRYIARDAADLIEVDYEPLPAVADPEKALAPGAPAVHPEWPDNVAFTFHQEGGDIDKAFARSRSGREAAHHQPAADSDRDGDARRGGGVARGRAER